VGGKEAKALMHTWDAEECCNSSHIAGILSQARNNIFSDMLKSFLLLNLNVVYTDKKILKEEIPPSITFSPIPISI